MAAADQIQMDGALSIAVRPNLWMRNPRRTRPMAAMITFLSVTWITIIFLPASAPFLTRAAICFGTAGLGLTIAARTAASGLRIGSAGIEVRSPFFTKRVPLADVAGFIPKLSTGAYSAGLPCPILERLDGRSLQVWALGRELLRPTSAEFQRTLQPLCDELNALLSELGGGRPLH
jgi:hypothetical protein